jgi:hypothetical protein
MANANLSNAKNARNDEFYTQFHDIEKEIAAYLEYNPDVFRGKIVLCPCDDPYESNFFKYFALKFNEFGLKKLIATCYAGSPIANRELSLFDEESAETKTTKSPHKIEITDINNGGAVNLSDVELLLARDRNLLTRLNGTGDFRSDEIKKLRDEADIIITNPPFSLFREFLAWIMEANKQFSIIGNMNAITYKETFPLLKENKIWLGVTSGAKTYIKPDKTEQKMGNTCWFTNLEHGRRHQPIPLMDEVNVIRYITKMPFQKYENYDAIEVSQVKSIPNDYEGIMGVPISFLEKYSPEQFEIFGMCENENLYNLKTKVYTTAECKQAYFAKFNKTGTYDLNASGVVLRNGLLEKVYQRILIKHKK